LHSNFIHVRESFSILYSELRGNLDHKWEKLNIELEVRL